MNSMIKHLPAGVFLLSILLMSACGSDDDPSTQNLQTGTTTTKAQLSVSSCDSIHYHGRLERTVALGADNYFYVKVNVSAKGTYSFKTAENNGYYFIAEGEFTSTGVQELRFVGKGTPTTAKVDDVVLEFGNAICGQKVTVYEKNYPNPDATVILVTGEPFMASSYYTYAFNGNGKQLWRLEGGSSTPAVSGDVAYMISNNEVYARNILTGTQVWKTSMGLSLQEGPVTIDGDNLYVTGTGKLMSIARATGAVNWTYTFGSMAYSMWAPTVSNGKLFAAYDKNLYCLDLAGNLVWTYPMTNSIRSNPAVNNGVVYVGNDGGVLTAINISDKSTLWTSNIGMTGEESPTIDNGKVYVQGATKVFCLDAITGNSVWTYTIESGTADWSSPTVANGIVYVAGFNKGVLALDATTGAKQWNNNAAAETAENPPTVLNSMLVEGGPNGLAAINAITGATVWNIAPFAAGTSTTPITFYTSAVIYNRDNGQVAYPSTSGHKQ